MKRVYATKAGQSISAYVILRPNGDFVAKVHSHYSDAGNVTVDVYNFGTRKGKPNPDAGKGIQHGSAGGYGYDKFTAALSGLSIDGYKMTDHCTRGNRRHKDVRGANYDAAIGDYADWYIEPGLGRLEARGYSVIQAI